jgi:hypothetical protein
MNKKVAFILLIILAVAAACSCFIYYSNINRAGLSGTVRHRSEPLGDRWGIESDKWYKNYKISVKNLPQEFQREGMSVDCDAVIVDVVGTDPWNIYAEVSNCKAR